jgi:hypothetical protein
MEDRKKGVDNGVVFLIATEDRTMSIQQGRAVEQYLTASVAGQIWIISLRLISKRASGMKVLTVVPQPLWKLLREIQTCSY